MTPEIIDSFLWRVRTGLRLKGLLLSAGHGFADPNYRPPKLPYVSVIGPLDLQREAERDPPRSLFMMVQSPGYAAGARRAAQDVVPAAGQLHLRFDGDASVSLALDFGGLANRPLDDGDTGRQAAAVMQTALIQAVQNDQFRIGGIPVTDAARLEELRAATVRWQRELNRFVISSGRRGTLPQGRLDTHRPTQVDILSGPDDLGPALGFGEGVTLSEGRLVRHRVPNPVAVAVDVRIDLWAGSQHELATVLDAWARLTPTRGQVFIRPALPADDIAHGASRIRLQTGGECPVRSTLIQLESDCGFTDRLSGRALSLANGAAIEDRAMRFSGEATASLSFREPPPIPSPLEPEHPAPHGYALSLGLRADPGAADGHAFRILSLEHQGRTALRIDLRYHLVGDALQAEIHASAEQGAGQPFSPAVGVLAVADLESGAELHAVLDAGGGAVSLFHNGRRISAQPETPAPGSPAGGSDMRLILGPSGQSPLGFRIAHLQLHGYPYGPTEPFLRRTLSLAAAWSPGDPVTVVRTQNGVDGGKNHFTATVVAIDQDTLVLDRPVQGDWPRSTTAVFKKCLFFSQKQLRRRDDLMNKLYRIAVEYRVSAFLEERYSNFSVPLVETPLAHVLELSRVLALEQSPEDPDYPARPAQGCPGVRTALSESQASCAES